MPPKAKAKARTRRAFGHLRQLPSGRWQAKYIGPDLAEYRAPNTFDSKTAAEGWLADERRLIDLGAWVSPAERDSAATAEPEPLVTLREWATEWVEAADLAPRTRREYRDKLRLYILPELGSVPLASVDREMVKGWLATMGTDHPRATSHAYGVLSSCINAAIEAGKRPIEPAFAVKGASRSKARQHTDMLTPAELASVAAAMTEPGEGFAVLLMAWNGLRPGELFELRRKDVSRDRTKVTTSRSVSRDREAKADVVGPTKTEDVRTVELPPHLVPMLKEHLAERVASGSASLLFPDPTGGHMRQRQFSDRFKKALAAAGVESDLRVYDLRAFGGTMALVAGGTLMDAMHRLGHKTPNAAMHYQRATRGSEVAKRLSVIAGA